MAPKITDFVEDAGAPGIIAGIGAILLAPVLIPVVAGIGKPIAKSLVKGGIVAYEKSRGAFAEIGETWEDIIAEAKAEIAEDRETPTFEASADNTVQHGG
ncbi:MULTISPECIES: DUF5132 domain-containing protein [unclassified Nodularia (in: cyanobacteria)]|uniref:DUF5132 domain-containing protein n=1 Tax=unclassified Nodularia (in: cyanobacteria) TaxID=2656917 RepID=UPI00187F36F2|nr:MULTISPECIES: DUF5132 domain-containing protein [unclassified Nodularia (in: cyanobacteria)]MBE9198624.1 DUF5132 domain-containing protein [Nodularia sp. LEGE 06071]MCC2691807.1 DUF5132 domain-containing protein [Nodularia sp. LEGE 04288]